MRIICNQELLINSIHTVVKACSSKTTMPILECILIKAKNNQITLVGYNLELGIESTITAEVIEEGCIALEAKIFSEIIRKLPNQMVEITTDNNNMTSITCAKSKFAIAGQVADQFPELPEVKENKKYTISQIALKEMIRQTIFSVAQEESRPILTGEMIQIRDGSLHMVSVDGYRISYRQLDISNENGEEEVVVPGRTLGEISKILSSDDDVEMDIYFEEKHILFDLGSSKVVSRLLEGEFLKYEQVFSSDYETKVKVDRKNFLMCIERAALISREGKKNPIKIEIEGDTMIITSKAELGTAREELSIQLEGNQLSISFNPKYLIDALKSIDEDEVSINFISALTPCIINPIEGNHYKYLILPIRSNA
ncbi:MAG: DNA polymerase III subunit beta [Cellulosilyticaceae bacterium]